LKLTEIETLLPNVSALLSVDLKLYYGLISAEAFLAQNSLDNALASWNKVVWPIPPMDIDLLASYNVPFLNDCKARIYIKKGDIDKAIAEYNRLLNLNSPSHSRRLIHPKLHYRLAKLYQEKGDKENAINEYKNFLDLWKEADQDLPELIDAKVRYANLRRLN
jgi:tetratricopeptide (TPR) repeat protein